VACRLTVRFSTSFSTTRTCLRRMPLRRLPVANAIPELEAKIKKLGTDGREAEARHRRSSAFFLEGYPSYEPSARSARVQRGISQTGEGAGLSRQPAFRRNKQPVARIQNRAGRSRTPREKVAYCFDRRSAAINDKIQKEESFKGRETARLKAHH
jgi:hypothetical protein